MRHARGRKLESGVQKNRSIKPKIRWKEKGLPDVWQGQHQVLEVQQAIIQTEYQKEQFSPKTSSFRGFLYIPINLSDTTKTHEISTVTNT